jgi:PAS domain-containing protein
METATETATETETETATAAGSGNGSGNGNGNGNGHGDLRAGGRMLVGFSGIARDVTAERAAKDELAASEQRYRDMFLRAPLAYQSLGLDTRIIDVNDAWLALLGGYRREEVLGGKSPISSRRGRVLHWRGSFPSSFHGEASTVRCSTSGARTGRREP